MSLLSALNDRALSRDAQPRMHELSRPSITVALTIDGSIDAIVRHPKPTKGETPYLVLAPKTAKGRSSGIVPILVTDNAQYVLGMNKEDGKQKVGRAKRAAYLALLRQATDDTGHPMLRTILNAAEHLQIENVTADDLITFSVDGEHPHDDPAVQAWWSATQGSEGETGQCAVTGTVGPLARNAPKMRGIPGGQANVNLLSLEGTAFQSHGLRHLGVSQSVIENTTRELQQLSVSRDHSYRIDSMSSFVIVHWTSGLGNDPFAALITADAADALHAETLRAPEGAALQPDLPGTLHVAVLTASGARVAPIDYRARPAAEVTAHVRQFVDRSRVVTWDGEAPRFSTIRAMLASTTYDGKVNKLVPALAFGLVKHALFGTPFPVPVFQASVLRWQQDLTLTPGRLSLVRLALCASGAPMEPTVQDPQSVPEPLRTPYVLGRYAAVADRIHRKANPTVSVTVTDNYLRGLAASPQSVWPMMDTQVELLLRTLGRAGTGRYLREELDDLLAHIDVGTLPRVFSNAQKGALMLGLHHQRASDRAGYRQRREAATSQTDSLS